MSLANRLLQQISEMNEGSNEFSYSNISEGKRTEYSDMTLPEYFASVFESNLESVNISLDESGDSDELYVDTQISGVPVSFRFFVENENPALEVLSWNESTDQGISKVVRLSKRMLNSEGDLVIEENLHVLPSEKIQEAVRSVVSVVEVMKTVTRKDPKTGQIKKEKVNVSSAELAKMKKQAREYYRKNKSRIKAKEAKRERKLASRGYTAQQLKDINKRRALKGMGAVDKSGNPAE